jgi:hypothetical protein
MGVLDYHRPAKRSIKVWMWSILIAVLVGLCIAGSFTTRHWQGFRSVQVSVDVTSHPSVASIECMAAWPGEVGFYSQNPRHLKILNSVVLLDRSNQFTGTVEAKSGGKDTFYGLISLGSVSQSSLLLSVRQNDGTSCLITVPIPRGRNPVVKFKLPATQPSKEKEEV